MVMREILFKGQQVDSDSKRWVQGSYEHVNQFHGIITKEGKEFPIDPLTLGQYTGVLDYVHNQGELKIFGADIVRVSHCETESPVPGDFQGTVMFREGMWLVDNGKESFPLWSELTRWQIVGNIHNDPQIHPQLIHLEN